MHAAQPYGDPVKDGNSRPAIALIDSGVARRIVESAAML